MGTTRRDLPGAGLALSLPFAVRAQSSDAPAQLRLGFQKSAVNLVLVKQTGVPERRFPTTRAP
ncbi:MAG TPA: hypothetical protein VFL64_00530 [Rhizobacter sp.]|nr:hypothetical protein [Rhizobacter sp.]